MSSIASKEGAQFIECLNGRVVVVIMRRTAKI